MSTHPPPSTRACTPTSSSVPGARLTARWSISHDPPPTGSRSSKSGHQGQLRPHPRHLHRTPHHASRIHPARRDRYRRSSGPAADPVDVRHGDRRQRASHPPRPDRVLTTRHTPAARPKARRRTRVAQISQIWIFSFLTCTEPRQFRRLLAHWPRTKPQSLSVIGTLDRQVPADYARMMIGNSCVAEAARVTSSGVRYHGGEVFAAAPVCITKLLAMAIQGRPAGSEGLLCLKSLPSLPDSAIPPRVPAVEHFSMQHPQHKESLSDPERTHQKPCARHRRGTQGNLGRYAHSAEYTPHDQHRAIPPRAQFRNQARRQQRMTCLHHHSRFKIIASQAD